jgi:hypothetical protein
VYFDLFGKKIRRDTTEEIDSDHTEKKKYGSGQYGTHARREGDGYARHFAT